MFYYVIYNSTVLNYSENNKSLNTFIYGTVLYILLHGLINSYNNQFALYIKSYFWVILSIDIFSIYYMYNYLNQDLENDKNSLKELISSFYTDKKEKTDKTKTDKTKTDKPKTDKKEKTKKQEEEDQEDQEEEQEEDEQKEESEPEALLSNSNLESYSYENMDDQMSDAGSDIDLDKFEMSL